MQRLGRRSPSFGRHWRLLVLSSLIKVIPGFFFILFQRRTQLQ